MRKKNGSMWVWMLGAAVGLASCGVDMPKCRSRIGIVRSRHAKGDTVIV